MQALASLFPESQAQRAHLEYISGRSESPKPSLRPLQQELEKRKAKLAHYQEIVSRLDSDNAHLEQQRENLLVCIEDVRRDVDTVTQDLRISRFAPDEGTMDEETVISEYRQLGRLTNDVVSHIIHIYPQDVLNSKLKQTSPDFQGVGLFLDLIRIRHPETKMELVLTYSIHYMIRQRMMDSVFRRIVPGIPSDDNDLLREIHQSVRAGETQERSARWRAMTYWHLKPELNRYDSIISRTMDDISRLLNGLIDRQVESRILMEHSSQKLKELFHFAANLQTRIQTACTSVNIEMFLPTGPMYDPNCMVPYDAAMGSTPMRYVMPIGLGLQKSWSVKEGNGMVHLRETYLQKASIICDNWQP